MLFVIIIFAYYIFTPGNLNDFMFLIIPNTSWDNITSNFPLNYYFLL